MENGCFASSSGWVGMVDLGQPCIMVSAAVTRAACCEVPPVLSNGE